MSKITHRDFACVHGGCGFKTDKRKAIVTHLIRTHSERKEDFECEYCDTLFEEEAVIEEHLYRAHPGCQFRYTCVSRLEQVLNKCAQLAIDRKKPAAKADQSVGKVKSEDNLKIASNIGIAEKDIGLPKAHPKSKKASQRETSQKRKASVNASLNNLAKLPRITLPEDQLIAYEQEVDKKPVDNEDEEVNTFISKPSGLKIKLNLKKIRDSCSRESSTEPQSNTNTEHSTADLREMSPIEDSDILHDDINDNLDQLESPGITPDQQSNQNNRSKYYDKLEVYHSTDEFNRRCCPFCDYKTTKNTIRVHLSGKHKIYFVQCSICDFKAAFPYQVQTHGLSSHKIPNIEVLQLPKSYREAVIANLQAGAIPEVDINDNPKLSDDHIEAGQTEENGADDLPLIEDGACQQDDKGQVQAKPSPPADTRVFKPPVCQTSKTDYYNIVFENNTYLYCCNQCEFRTPVRATIYTHKYRHGDKAYKCGYCDFISSPRSNVVHHIRVKHKGRAFAITETAGLDQLNLSGMDDTDQDEVLEKMGPDESDDAQSYQDMSQSVKDIPTIKQEPARDDVISDHWPRDNITESYSNSSHTQEETTKPHQTMLKVPQYKRTLTTVANNPGLDSDVKSRSTKRETGDQGEADLHYKMSINKLYRLNPKGTPKYLCNECPYATDTHPKMKHHLYRHKPQRYKCPYCNHRKYPRSYVVRHVRDTHRDKPLKVVDLLKSGDELPSLSDTDDKDESGDAVTDMSTLETSDESLEKDVEKYLDKLGVGNSDGDGTSKATSMMANTYIKEEPVEDQLYIPLDIDQTPPLPSPGIKMETPDVTNIPQPVSSSTPVAGSALFDFSPAEVTPIKPLIKNYDVDTKRKPRYICNFCHYGTENYKTIRNHMYSHEPVKYQCPYCGFKRAPRYICNFCHYGTENYKTIRNHMYSHEPVKYQCPYCGFKRAPRYICNFCHYGTENYKTIRNHMYSHEPVKFQCPYCGFKRAPRSFVEKHIVNVHHGQPIITTEVVEDGPHIISSDKTSCLKRKEPPTTTTPSALHPTLQKKLKTDSKTSSSKPSVKWPAPKPIAKASVHTPEMPPLQIPVKKKLPGSNISPIIPELTVPKRPITKPTESPTITVSPPPIQPVKQNQVNSVSKSSCTQVVTDENTKTSDVAAVVQNETQSKPTYKEGGKTTFKTMYKCVFDPETCNHISKDRSKMKQHLYMHVEYKPWTCDYCTMSASQSSHVKNHVRAEHPHLEISFRYKKHNYLEKHIDNFLTKGVFTVPVSEYRFIMDMKGSSKKQQYDYARDKDGYLLCPHCDYRTKSGGMADHVKMKHMQPRFKCHWCDFKAFYRSEVRKHHRKERGHASLEFKTQELDLAEVLTEYKEGIGDIPDALQTTSLFDKLPDTADESEAYTEEDPDDNSDMEDDTSSNADSAISDSASLSSNLIDSVRVPLTVPFSFDSIDSMIDAVADNKGNTEQRTDNIEIDQVNYDESVKGEKTEQLIDNFVVKKDTADIAMDGNLKKEADTPKLNKPVQDSHSIVGMKTREYKKGKADMNSSKFKCGYCLFTAGLRTMVKLHCHKQHPYQKINIVEQKSKPIEPEVSLHSSQYVAPDNCNDPKKSENDSFLQLKVSAHESNVQDTKPFSPNNDSGVKQDNIHVIQKPAIKKSKNLNSVINQLCSIAMQKIESSINSVIDKRIENSYKQSSSSAFTAVDPVSTTEQQPEDNTDVCNLKTDNKMETVFLPSALKSTEQADLDVRPVSPPILTNELCSVTCPLGDERNESSATPPLLINESDECIGGQMLHSLDTVMKKSGGSKPSSECSELQESIPNAETDKNVDHIHCSFDTDDDHLKIPDLTHVSSQEFLNAHRIIESEPNTNSVNKVNDCRDMHTGSENSDTTKEVMLTSSSSGSLEEITVENKHAEVDALDETRDNIMTSEDLPNAASDATSDESYSNVNCLSKDLNIDHVKELISQTEGQCMNQVNESLRDLEGLAPS